MKQTCVYLINDDPFYMQMCAHSAKLLRQYNSKIEVNLFFIEQNGKYKNEYPTKEQFFKTCDKLNVNIIHRSYYEANEESYFPINKAHLKDCPGDRILFIDCDTFIFGDVATIFKKYEKYDVAACKNKWALSEDMNWNSEYLDKKLDPLNSGVMLWDGDWMRKASKEMVPICLDLKERKLPLSEWIYKISPTCWNREEFAYSVFAARNNLNYCYFDRQDVYNMLWRQDIETAGDSTILHTYTSNWREVYNKIFNPKKPPPKKMFWRSKK